MAKNTDKEKSEKAVEKKYKKGDINDKVSKIDLDKYNFKNSDVVKWTEMKPTQVKRASAQPISGLSSLGTRSRFRKG